MIKERIDGNLLSQKELESYFRKRLLPREFSYINTESAIQTVVRYRDSLRDSDLRIFVSPYCLGLISEDLFIPFLNNYLVCIMAKDGTYESKAFHIGYEYFSTFKIKSELQENLDAITRLKAELENREYNPKSSDLINPFSNLFEKYPRIRRTTIEVTKNDDIMFELSLVSESPHRLKTKILRTFLKQKLGDEIREVFSKEKEIEGRGFGVILYTYVIYKPKNWLDNFYEQINLEKQQLTVKYISLVKQHIDLIQKGA